MTKEQTNLFWQKLPLRLLITLIIVCCIIPIINIWVVTLYDGGSLYFINRENGIGVEYNLFSAKNFTLKVDNGYHIRSLGVSKNATNTVFVYEQTDRQAASGSIETIGFETQSMQYKWQTRMPSN